MSNVSLVKIEPTNADAVQLIDCLNQYQIELYGIDKCNLESPSQLSKNNAYMLGAYIDKSLVGIGSVKIKTDHAEIKRMFVDPNYRGFGIGDKIIKGLEQYALAQGINNICLETGNKHEHALNFYRKKGYQIIKCFGTYLPNDVSVYMQKCLIVH